MFTTNLKRTDLLLVLKANRDKHRGIYEQAFDKYRAAVIAETERMLDEFKAGGIRRIYVNLPVPEDHTDDYNAVIGLLENSTETVVQLDVGDYTQFYMDDWSWKQQWAITNSSYLDR